jgi:FMN phosphatase YigB (HAD superfamily)
MSFLADIQAYAFDVFGTLTDFLSSVSATVEHNANGKLTHEKALEFTKEWRKLLMEKTWEHSQFRDGIRAPNIDQLHREVGLG